MLVRLKLFLLLFSSFSSFFLLATEEEFVAIKEEPVAAEEKSTVLQKIRFLFQKRPLYFLDKGEKPRDFAGHIIYDEEGRKVFYITTKEFGFREGFMLVDEEAFYPMKQKNHRNCKELYSLLKSLPHGQHEIRLYHSPWALEQGCHAKATWHEIMGVSKVKAFYEEEIYPLIFFEIQRILKERPEINQIVDLGAGSGAFLEALAKHLNPDSFLPFVLVEQNEVLFNLAREKEYGERMVLFKNCSVFSLDKSFIKRNALIISSGFLANEVLNKKEQKLIPDLLKSFPLGCHIIVTGLTPPLVDKRILESGGFMVSKMVIPERLQVGVPSQMYVARKK